MTTLTNIPSAQMNRRTFFARLGAAAVVGSTTTLGVARPAKADGVAVFPDRSAPNPIPFLAGPTGAPDPYNFIHWTLPGRPGTVTQFNELPAFGLDIDPSVMTDYEGFTTYAILGGSARSSKGEDFDCELDVRVFDGVYIGEDGQQHRGLFGFV